MNLQLPTGKTMHINSIDFLFMSDTEIETFYQSAIADDLGEFVENPFVIIHGREINILIEEPNDISI